MVLETVAGYHVRVMDLVKPSLAVADSEQGKDTLTKIVQKLTATKKPR
jgi:hypothetical protein